MPYAPGFPRDPLPGCEAEREAIAIADSDFRVPHCRAPCPTATYCVCNRPREHEGAHVSTYWSHRRLPVIERWL